MGLTAIYIATEDTLSEAVTERLVLEDSGLDTISLGRVGKDYLRKKLREFTRIARSIPFFLLTDLDCDECPAALINNWRRTMILPEGMFFRVAVRGIEAWLLADREGFANFSGVPLHRVPMHPEKLCNPKEALLNLVRRHGKRSVKNILPDRGSTSKIGLAYNQVLCGFVQELWSPDRAAQAADSLNRFRRRLREL